VSARDAFARAADASAPAGGPVTLAIDTSTDTLSVALRTAGGWAEASLEGGLHHAERVMDLVDFCLDRAGIGRSDLELAACARGPGSFTGLRIGMAASKGIAAALGIPWISVPTLDALAWGLDSFPGAVAPIIDGRQGKLYSAVYLRGKRVGDWLDIHLAKLVALLDTYPEALVTGPDAELFREIAAERSGFRIDERAGVPAARAIAVLGARSFLRDGAGSPDEGPLYLRSSGADESAAR
jgi:tRNA threonylcarbamoyladenosine biosynthesis protein TsaB